MFPYIGGKSHHAKWIDNKFPHNFDTYVEVFGGAGWVLLKSNKVKHAGQIIYNDFNTLLSNAFECFRTSTLDLYRKMCEYEKSNVELYRKFQRELFSEDFKFEFGDLEVAAKYLYLQTQIFSGTPLSSKNVYYFTDVKSNGKQSSKYETLKKKLINPKISCALTRISKVENLDCIELIRKYDSPTTLFYVDPPYFNKEFYYTKEFPTSKHFELADTLKTIQGKFALSYYDFDELHEMYPEKDFQWHHQKVYKSAATRSGNDKDYAKKSRTTELLIMNY